jgi:myo-inositol-1-phosphate synthase
MTASNSGLGLMVVGYRGNTGATLIGTLALLDAGVLDWARLPSSITGHIDAPVPHEIHLAGWDPQGGSVRDTLVGNGVMPGAIISMVPEIKMASFDPVLTPLDYAERDGDGDSTASEAVSAAMRRIVADIHRFREAAGVERPIIVYLGSPAQRTEPSLAELDQWTEVVDRRLDSVPGSLIYAAGAVEAGADFIDFTPSEPLICPALLARAETRSSQLVGRDGSTGQTMLKAAVAEMLQLRGLAPRSWYSSNHLGNADGRVLADSRFTWLKLQDKTRGLEEIVASDVDHVVSIDYLASKGDRKESFDSVVAEDIFGGEVRLRLNWEAWDSALATPMLLDLIRLVMLGQRMGLRGPQEQLGFFFKSPVGGPCRSPEAAHQAMVRFYWSGVPST